MWGWYGSCSSNTEGVSYRDPLRNITRLSEIRVFGRVEVLFLDAYRQKGSSQQEGSAERLWRGGVGSIISRRQERTGILFSRNTNIEKMDLASRSGKKSPYWSWNGEIQDRGAARRGSFFCPPLLRLILGNLSFKSHNFSQIFSR